MSVLCRHSILLTHFRISSRSVRWSTTTPNNYGWLLRRKPSDWTSRFYWCYLVRLRTMSNYHGTVCEWHCNLLELKSCSVNWGLANGVPTFAGRYQSTPVRSDLPGIWKIHHRPPTFAFIQHIRTLWQIFPRWTFCLAIPHHKKKQPTELEILPLDERLLLDVRCLFFFSLQHFFPPFDAKHPRSNTSSMIYITTISRYIKRVRENCPIWRQLIFDELFKKPQRMRRSE